MLLLDKIIIKMDQMNQDCAHAYDTVNTKNEIIIVFWKYRIDVVSPI